MKAFHRLTTAVLMAGLSAIVAPVMCTAGELYGQPPVEDAGRIGLGFFSHSEAGARRDYRHVDDFRLSADARVSAVRWWGLVDGTRSSGLDNLRSFTLRIMETDADGAPGAVVFESSYALAQTAPRATGRSGSGIDEASTAQEYVHEVSVDSDPALHGGQAYFLEITAGLVDLRGDNWQWQDGETRNGVSYSYSYRKQRWLRVEDTDSAFVVLGEHTARLP